MSLTKEELFCEINDFLFGVEMSGRELSDEDLKYLEKLFDLREKALSVYEEE